MMKFPLSHPFCLSFTASRILKKKAETLQHSTLSLDSHLNGLVTISVIALPLVINLNLSNQFC